MGQFICVALLAEKFDCPIDRRAFHSRSAGLVTPIDEDPIVVPVGDVEVLVGDRHSRKCIAEEERR